MKSKLLSVLVNNLQVIFWLLYWPILIWEIISFLIVQGSFTVVNSINKEEKYKYSLFFYFSLCFNVCLFFFFSSSLIALS